MKLFITLMKLDAQMADKTLESISSSQIMPVIRATSFDKKIKQGVPFIYDEHLLQKLFINAVDLKGNHIV